MLTRIPGSSKDISRIGFGCASLVGGLDRKNSAKLIEAALDAGIRHFDVAPNYGLGLAEDVLGAILSKMRNDVTITTKAGIQRPKAGFALSAIRATAAPIMRKLLATKSFSQRVGAALSTGNKVLDGEGLKGSLNESLRRLKTDHVDVFLVHEILPSHVAMDLRAKFEDLKRQGMIGAFGIGMGGFAEEDLSEHSFGQVNQYAFDAFRPRAGNPAIFEIKHRVVLNNHTDVSLLIQTDHNRANALATELDYDLFDAERLPDLLLAAALSANDKGIVLVSTRRIDRLKRYSQIPNNSKLMASGRLLNARLEYIGRPTCTSAGSLSA